MPTDSKGVVDTVTDISSDRRITQERIADLIQNLGFDPESANYNIAMEDMVEPTTGEAMMDKRAEVHEERLIIDAIIRETLSHPPLAIYTPKEEDMNQMRIPPRDEPDEISRESTAGLWLHMAAEISKASSTLLISPVIISSISQDSYDHHFHTNNFDKEDAQELIDIINQP